MSKNPTQNQLDFVRDIEDAVIDLIQRNVKVTKIYQVTEQAGRETHDLTNYVKRFQEVGHWDLIARLAEAYLKVGQAPNCLVTALEASPDSKAIPTAKQTDDRKASNFDSQPLKLERSLPSVPSIPKPHIVNAEVLQAETGKDLVDDLAAVIRMIQRWDRPSQMKLADQVYRWVGVGE